ncbi:DTW domain-containing protein 2 [Trichonephila inaurata madagascariensis]|uniref:tRNA-uridine aminocarboxypropyltransferase n=1 Tax=Trichonephila inaurata madagascariensis TaxID=2747483 RepID=A0A8X6K744_9ARAC|nr:DTW domain-containing protein 2 [Trichonephila inaurata madagascariensis]
MNFEDLNGVFQELSCIPADPPTKRELCTRCRRPLTVCWCPFLPREPLQVKSSIIILQHPGEEKRCLRTAPMLEYSLPKENFLLLKGRRFSSGINEKLKAVFSSPNSFVCYPGPDAVDIETLPTVDVNHEGYNIIILDGTWPQAKSLYTNCDELKKIKQIQINSKVASEYVIRTQPTEKALSTVETAAIALAILEGKPNLKDALLQPLKALCNFQLAHGAETHQSKEFLIKNGLHKSQIQYCSS